MHEAERLRRSGATWLVGCSMVASLLNACGEQGEQPSAIQGVADSSGIGQPAADGGMSQESSSAMPGPADGGRDRSTAPERSQGSDGAASSSAEAGAEAGTDAAADAGSNGTDASRSSPDSAVDAGSLASDAGITSVCRGGTLGMDSDSVRTAPLTVAREYAAVKYLAATPIQILSLKTTMQVPKTPSSKQTLFIWPGLQSKAGASDPARIGNGVLQPVLTWGPSCAPKAPRDTYGAWWMAAMYVNVSTSAAGPTGCAGGDYMTTEVGDLLEIDMSVKGAAWSQTITDLRSMESVDLTIDLKGQVQNAAMWVIEVPSGETIKPSGDVVFTQSVLTFSAPVTSCQPSQAGTNDYFSAPVLSRDGLHCCYDKIVLRAQRGSSP